MQKQRIGIWGFGAVGNSALRHFKAQANTIEILDLKEPAMHILPATFTKQESPASINAFLKRNDTIVVSPGIDTSCYVEFQHKFVNELDIVSRSTTTPIIGITGTIGKTTVTTLLSYYLHEADLTVGTGGNIGTPMLDVAANADAYDYLVFELSSFQLEFSTRCAPKLAVWTNLYPNHLDRHLTMEQYFLSKFNVMRHQGSRDIALVPLSLAPLLMQHRSHIHAQRYFFSLQAPTSTERAFVSPTAHFFYVLGTDIIFDNGTTTTSLISLNDVQLSTYPENIVLVAAALFCLGVPVTLLKNTHQRTSLEHRLEYVATHHAVAFYNDSKSTIMQATLAAIEALQDKNIILLLGGLSKGVDRTADIQKLAGMVKYVVCFGGEAAALHEVCRSTQIPSSKRETLEDAFHEALEQARLSDNACVVLSPGGSSFDLFSNYQERGKRFKELVAALPS